MILISGGGGFLGLNTAKALAADGQSVVITTRRRGDPMAGKVAKESKGLITLEVIDLNNPHEVSHLFSRYHFDQVVHTATNHMFSQSRAANFTSYNMLFNVLEAATAAGVKRFVLANSMVVYRGVQGPWREDMPLPTEFAVIPGLLEGLPDFEVTLKRVMELVALDYGNPMRSWDRAPAHGEKLAHPQMETVALRFGGAQVGPYYSSMYNPLACLVHAVARGYDSTPKDRPLRAAHEVAYALDNANAIKTVLAAKTLPHRVYNVSSGIRITDRETLEALDRVAPGAREKLKLELPAKRDGVNNLYFDISRMKDDFGWEPKFNVDTMLENYIGWVRENEY